MVARSSMPSRAEAKMVQAGIGLFTPLRGTERDEALGMDFIHHGEEA